MVWLKWYGQYGLNELASDEVFYTDIFINRPIIKEIKRKHKIKIFKKSKYFILFKKKLNANINNVGINIKIIIIISVYFISIYNIIEEK